MIDGEMCANSNRIDEAMRRNLNCVLIELQFRQIDTKCFKGGGN